MYVYSCKRGSNQTYLIAFNYRLNFYAITLFALVKFPFVMSVTRLAVVSHAILKQISIWFDCSKQRAFFLRHAIKRNIHILHLQFCRGDNRIFTIHVLSRLIRAVPRYPPSFLSIKEGSIYTHAFTRDLLIRLVDVVSSHIIYAVRCLSSLMSQISTTHNQIYIFQKLLLITRPHCLQFNLTRGTRKSM